MTQSNPSHHRLIHRVEHDSHRAEHSTRLVLWITLVAMVAEIIAGWWFNSMALLADGWHMSSHAMAIGLSAFAYAAARHYAEDPSFTFGTWKIEVLAGFASAWFLLLVAALMAITSVERLLNPDDIHYPEALVVAVLGLAVNLICATILGTAHQHGEHHHEDLNLKSAYVHVLADAATSVLAILALTGGWLYGWRWLDPLTGIVGAVLIAIWAKNLLRQTATVLLDREMDGPLPAAIRKCVESENAQVSDLHVWRAGRQSYYCILTVVTDDGDLTPEHIRARLRAYPEIVHSTVEIQHRHA